MRYGPSHYAITCMQRAPIMEYVDSQSGYNQRNADGKHSTYYDEDGMDPSVLDPAILDADLIQSPHQSHFRKDSFANSHGVLSPAESHGWDHQQFHGMPVEPTSNAFSESQERLGHHNSHYQPTYVHPHPPQWKYEQDTGSCTPTTTGAEMMPPPPPFDNSQYRYRADQPHAPFNHPVHAPPQQPTHYSSQQEHTYAGPMHVRTPISPHAPQDWMGMAQQEIEARPNPKRPRPNSPPPSRLELARRDGIRKKNSRIDIPMDRTIHTIDELIDKTTDDDLLKELKQQKRLLRNREAALASRQRKKKHTEELEVKEKDYTQTIQQLQENMRENLTEYQNQRQMWDDEKSKLYQLMHERQRQVDALQLEMKTMRNHHIEETASLRGKIHMLTDQLEAGPAPAMSAAPSSTGFNDFNAEMEALNVDETSWENLFQNDISTGESDGMTFDPRSEHLTRSPMLEKRTSTGTIVPNNSKSKPSSSEQPVASGLLFFFLLLGAFVGSKPGNSQSRDLPEIPPEARAAAPTLLNSLLAADNGASIIQNSARLMHEPQRFAVAQMHPRNNGRLSRTQTTPLLPTQQQSLQQQSMGNMFVPAEQHYPSNTFTSAVSQQSPAIRHPEQIPPNEPRNLAGTLSQIQQDQPTGSKAEIYTRSLLWDQIPPEVVSQFRDMMREFDTRRGKQTVNHNNS